MAKIYTRTGDAGQCGLIGGARVSKGCQRIDAIGEVDEANAAIGFAATQGLDGDIKECLCRVQEELFDLGASLATPEEGEFKTSRIVHDQIERLEREIDKYAEEAGPLTHFVLPGGCAGAAQLHIARTVVRRAERSVVALSEREPVPGEAVVYLNRLSDLLFTLARISTRRSGVEEVKWIPEDRP